MMGDFMGWNLPDFAPYGATGNKVTARTLNTAQCFEIFNRLINIALARFKWVNLPPSCNEWALEVTLLFYGKALFFNDEDLGFMHTPVNLNGPFNVYYQSVKRHAFSYGYNKEYSIDNSVVIKANMSMCPDYLTIMNYAPKIADTLRAIDVHCKTLKRPYMIKCNEKDKVSVVRALNNIDDNEIAVIGEKMADTKTFEVLNLATNSNLQEMWACLKNYFNQVFNALGIKNNYTEKRERMITTEVEGEGNSIRHMLESELESRKQACTEINKMFGLNIDVEANEIDKFADEVIEMTAARVTGNLVGNEFEEEEEE